MASQLTQFRPACYMFVTQEQAPPGTIRWRPCRTGPRKWTWYKLDEVAAMIGLSPGDLWQSRFGFDNPTGELFVCRASGEILRIWKNMQARRYINNSRKLVGDSVDMREEIRTGSIFVPAGWVDSIFQDTDIPIWLKQRRQSLGST